MSSDVTRTFLQSAPIERNIIVQPAKERRFPGILWQLKRRVYGLCDASHRFSIAFTNELLKLGSQKLQLDPAMFIFFTNEDCNNKLREPNGMLVSHVDDLLRAEDQSFEDTVISQLKAIFAFGSDNDFDFTYVGLHIEQVAKGINVDQNHYLRSLDCRNLYKAVRNINLFDDSWILLTSLRSKTRWVLVTLLNLAIVGVRECLRIV